VSPILRKELRSMLRERRSWIVPTLYAAVLGSSVYLIVLASGESGAGGVELTGIVASIQWAAVFLLGPLLGAAGIASEREQGTWTRLLASPVARHSIVTGKVVAAWLYVVLMLSVSAPIAGLSLLLGGTDLTVLSGLYFTQAVVGFVFVAFGLAASSVFHRTWVASVVALAWTLGLALFTTVVLVATSHDHDPFKEHAWLLSFNPGYGMVLFFDGERELGSLGSWWGYLGAMGAMGGAALGFVYRRVAVARE
jgi:ABC-type transport system involved in multi-copper enzyme maturation permease subunit